MKLFISHQSEDKEAAFHLHETVGAIGSASGWLDAFELAAGDTFDEITEAIREADVVVVLWSKRTDVSAWVREELALSDELGKPIIPCILDETLPDEHPVLRNRLYIDYQDPALGVGHLFLSALLPLMLDEHDLDDVVEAVRAYEAMVSVCIRELILQQRSLDHVTEWRERLQETYDDLCAHFAWLMKRRSRVEPEVRDVVEDVEPIIRDMQEAIESRLDDLADQVAAGAFDEGPSDFAALAARFDPEATRTELLGALAGIELYIPVSLAAELLNYYVASSFDVMQRLISVSERVEADLAAGVLTVDDDTPSPDDALIDVNTELIDYLLNDDDLLPEDRFGQLGYLDDAWLIHNVAYRLIEAGVTTPAELQIDPSAVSLANHLAQMLLPLDVTEELEELVLELVSIAANHVGPYERFTVTDPDGIDRYWMP